MECASARLSMKVFHWHIAAGTMFLSLFEYVGVPRKSERHQIEFWITALVRICRQLAGQRVLPSRVTVTHRRRESSSELSAFLGSDMVFGAAVDEVAFSETIRHLPVVGADPYLNELLRKHFEEALRNRRTNRSPVRIECRECDHPAAAARESDGR